jgi:hypothetical protein
MKVGLLGSIGVGLGEYAPGAVSPVLVFLVEDVGRLVQANAARRVAGRGHGAGHFGPGRHLEAGGSCNAAAGLLRGIGKW